jgi:hypothetical protein
LLTEFFSQILSGENHPEQGWFVVEHIRIQNDLHLRPRTLAMAASTSDLFNPALRACSLACLIKSSTGRAGVLLAFLL